MKKLRDIIPLPVDEAIADDFGSIGKKLSQREQVKSPQSQPSVGRPLEHADVLHKHGFKFTETEDDGDGNDADYYHKHHNGEDHHIEVYNEKGNSGTLKGWNHWHHEKGLPHARNMGHGPDPDSLDEHLKKVFK